ncbi:tetratricopeptide repeat protein [Myxococcus sp. MxC21-1]|nr:tetratricopeptide repeat protein [Myxococcus sp. MxC21-1]WNZ64026.1 tetratricopeptide repeat protein [Myxococcus sp. MxC21-1]
MLNEAQDYEAAVTELEAAVRAAPDFASARLNLGNAHRGQGNFARARAEYEQVLMLMPRTADAYFNLAILYLDVEPPGMEPLKRYKTALTHFDNYQARGGRDDRIPQYVKDARKLIDREERRLEREQKDQLRKAAEAQKAAEASPPREHHPPPRCPTPSRARASRRRRLTFHHLRPKQPGTVTRRRVRCPGAHRLG